MATPTCSSATPGARRVWGRGGGGGGGACGEGCRRSEGGRWGVTTTGKSRIGQGVAWGEGVRVGVGAGGKSGRVAPTGSLARARAPPTR